jgi:hypothetical protein
MVPLALQPQPVAPAPVTTGEGGQTPSAAALGHQEDAAQATRILVTNHPMKKGAGEEGGG